jgi:hypothetical protein
MAKKKRRHQAPRMVRVPPRNAKRWEEMRLQAARLMEQAGALNIGIENEVRAWAEGIGVRIGEGQPPHYHLAERCTELRAGEPPKPKVIDIKDLLKMTREAGHAKDKGKAKARA